MPYTSMSKRVKNLSAPCQRKTLRSPAHCQGDAAVDTLVSAIEKEPGDSGWPNAFDIDLIPVS